MKNKLFSIAFICASFFSLAQVGINTDKPDPASDLTLASPNKGLRLNKVALTNTGNAAPLSAHVQGMYVYNTAITSDVTEGVYYNDGVKWINVSSNDWKILGNPDSSISSSTQTLGTAYTSGNVLGTLGADNLVIVSGGKVHSILTTNGTLSGGGEDASSFSWGRNNVIGATTPNIALGFSNSATGDYAVSMGRGNNITANNSLVFGLTNTVSGNKNYVIGANNNVTSGNGLALIGHTFVAGSNNTISSLNSVVLGHSNNITSPAHVLGTDNIGRGTMIGFNNNNEGGGFLIGGQNSSATGALRSIVVGYGGNVTVNNTTMLANGYHLFNHNSNGNTTEVGINITNAQIVEGIDLTVDRAIRIIPQTPNSTVSTELDCTTINEGTIRYNLTNRKHQGCGSNGAGALAWRDLY